MILRYGAKNFFSFKEGVEISFELGANCPKEISRGKKVANLICLKGANASGKTNALKAISFLRYFCTDSFNNKPEDDIYVDSYFHNDTPIDLYSDFEIDGVRYNYEVSLTSREVISETLSRNKKRNTEVFKRDGNKLTYCIKDFNDLKSVKLRSNASIISTAHQYEFQSTAPIYRFFNSITSNVRWGGRYDRTINYETISKFYVDYPDFFEFVKDIIKKSDLGIKDIKIVKRSDAEGKEYHCPMFEHKTSVQNNCLSFHSQSSGTKTLYLTLIDYYLTLKSGGILVMDEFDIDFHPHILPLLVESFDDDKINKNNAQMIFSTHNTDILDFMGKYRTIMVNQEESESYAYRLDEIPGDIIRNDRSIVPIYNAGKIGGVPKI